MTRFEQTGEPTEGVAAEAAERVEEEPAGGFDDWHRVHPITPALKSWLIIVAIIGGILAQSQDLIGSYVEWIATGQPPEDAAWIAEHSWIVFVVLGSFLVIIALIVVLNWAVWRVLGYRIDDTAVYLRKGIISKQLRKARLDRVQSIDINQPLVPRLFGMAALKFDVAGGDDSSVDIEYLRRDRAEELRDQMLERVRSARAAPGPATSSLTASGPAAPGAPAPASAPGSPAAAVSGDPGAVTGGPAVGADATAAQPSAPRRRADDSGKRGATLGSRVLAAIGSGAEDVAGDLESTLDDVLAPYRVDTRSEEDGSILRVPAHTVLLSKLLSFTTVIAALVLVIMVVGITVLMILGRWDIIGPSLAGVIPGIIGVYTVLKNSIEEANFSARLTVDGLSVTHGLTTTTRRIVPLHRIQAVRLTQPILWRRMGWWRAEYNIAGQSESEQATMSNTVLPVGSVDQALMMLGLVMPDPQVPGGLSGRALITSAMHGAQSDDPEAERAEELFTGQPRSSRWLDPLTHHRNGFAVTGTMLVIRSGRLNRVVDCVPHARVQSSRLSSGPLERALGLAGVDLHSTTGPAKPAVRHLSADVAQRFFLEHAETTRRARAEMDA